MMKLKVNWTVVYSVLAVATVNAIILLYWLHAKSQSDINTHSINIERSKISKNASHIQALRREPLGFEGQLRDQSGPASLTIHQRSPVVKLPSFSRDFSEYLISAIVDGEITGANYVNIFLLGHQIIFKRNIESDSKHAFKVIGNYSAAWSYASTAFEGISYLRNGKRSAYPRYYCRIRHSPSTTAYVVSGEFIPTALSSDTSIDEYNMNMEILRCPLETIGSEEESSALLSKNLDVEIFRQTERWDLLAHIQVPWSLRISGYLSPLTGSHYPLRNWQPTYDGRFKVDLCILPHRVDFSSDASLRILSNYVDHHLSIGINHIYLPIASSSESYFRVLKEKLYHFVDLKKVTVMPLCEHEGWCVPYYIIEGMILPDNVISEIFVNTCIYLSRNEAHYVQVISIDEVFIIDKDSIQSISHLLQSVDVADTSQLSRIRTQDLQYHAGNWIGGQGWADREAHPLCYLRTPILNAAELTKKYKHTNKLFLETAGRVLKKLPAVLNDHMEVALRPIYPTARIFHAAAGSGGCCVLPSKWNACLYYAPVRDDREIIGAVCNDKTEIARLGVVWVNGTAYHFHNAHSKYERVRDADSKAIRTNAASIFPVSLNVQLIPATMADWNKVKSAANIPSINVDTITSITINRAYSQANKLPTFSLDKIDYILSALIERESDSYDLHITSFLLCHELLAPGNDGPHSLTAVNIDKQRAADWVPMIASSDKNIYSEVGDRLPNYKIRCRIQESSTSAPYIVEGMSVPNKLSVDTNSNRRLDVIRCPLVNSSIETYKRFARSNESVTIELLREDSTNTELGTVIATFAIAWAKRATGYLFEPADTVLDPWKGFDLHQQKLIANDKLYMCVPGLEMPITTQSAHIYLEFVEYHLRIGVKHIFFASALAWNSSNSLLLRRILSPYVKQGVVTLVSGASDGIDHVYTTSGLHWARDNVKIFHVNMCTYFSMGMADYVGVWDFDEFLTLQGNISSVEELLDQVDTVRTIDHKVVAYGQFPGARCGMADGHRHPLCYLNLAAAPTMPKADFLDYNHSDPWIGTRFSHEMEGLGHPLGLPKSIRPTRRVFLAGLHVTGVCKLPYPWNGCTVTDTHKQKPKLCYANTSTTTHSFYESVEDADAKLVDPKTQAVINHVQYFRYWHRASANASLSLGTYAKSHFPQVLQSLDDKNLMLPVVFPEYVAAPISQISPITRANATSNTTFNSKVKSLPIAALDNAAIFILAAYLKSEHISVIFYAHRSDINQSLYFEDITCTIKNTFNSFQPYVVPATIQPLLGPRSIVELRCRLDADTIQFYSSNLTENLIEVNLSRRGDLVADLILSSQKQFVSDYFDSSTSMTDFSIYPRARNVLVLRGSQITVSKRGAIVVLESIQHHLLLGYELIYLIAPFPWHSLHMQRLKQLCRPFIRKGNLAILSLVPRCTSDYCTTHFDLASSTDFIADSYDSNVVEDTDQPAHLELVSYLIVSVLGRLLAVNSVGSVVISMWDVNSFLIVGSNVISKQAINELDCFPSKNSFCIHSPISRSVGHRGYAIATPINWIGAVFTQGYNRDTPTRSVAKQLEVVFNNLITKGNNEQDAMYLLSFEIYNNTYISSSTALRKHNKYSKVYFPNVIASLRDKYLDLVVELPSASAATSVSASSYTVKMPSNWQSYSRFYKEVMKNRQPTKQFS